MAFYPDLKGKVVLLTGGANGIGAATVRAFHQQGATVCFCDLDVKGGNALVKELGGTVFFSEVNLLKQEEIFRWIEHTGKRWRKIHVLVNNAARDPRIAFDTM